MTLALRAAARSDVGLVRASNQDSGFAGARFIVVADGMGGHAGGDVASATAVAELMGLDDEAHGAEAPQRLADAVARAQTALLRRVAAEPALAGMGTTVTALLRAGERLVLAHLGDSRAYLLRDGALAQVTRDHTFVQRLVDEGRITAAEAEHHPQRNVILRVLGDVQSSPDPDLSVQEAHVGDRWLLCSDGLPRVVSDETIERTLLRVGDVGACAETLVELALRAGAPDNVTCVVADVVEVEPGGPPATERQVVGAAGERPDPAERAVRIPTSPAMRAAGLGRGSTPSPVTPPTGAPAPVTATLDASATDLTDRPAARQTDPQPDSLEDPDDDGQPRPVTGRRPDDPPPRPARVRWGLRALVLLAVVLVLGGGALAGSAWLGRQYFVADDNGTVAIYRGLSQDVGPLHLSQLVSPTDLRTSELPELYRQRVDATMTAGSLGEAEKIVQQLRDVSSTANATGSTGPTGGIQPSPTDSLPSPTITTTTAAP
ncbi:protein phosphatase [Quadrisphaera granulorum]|uniref:Protein phosphatase n=1 Tax=Quadrisphaera granulorum TaxID=317664 RepID=A0A316ADQ7_9ACTN|nr:PP2C family serine/threonine-protein phosphatase [Quadrisphaera granulorum]PWJ55742.1 protein phosphatase [Quadrisphaera granulorum]SZE95239.1 protein phosphatase [Quadrisphaera granulorum]